MNEELLEKLTEMYLQNPSMVETPEVFIEKYFDTKAKIRNAMLEHAKKNAI